MEEIKMLDYKKMSTDEVQRIAKQGDKDALYELAWRVDLLPPEHRDDPVESAAMQDYWLEKAADAGHIEAKGTYAYSLINRIMNAEDRQKAMKYFQSLVEDFDAGRLSADQREEGAYAQLWLGVMLCQGYHTRRDAVKGVELIKAAETFFNGFEGFGYRPMKILGDLYWSGLAQPGEEASVADLEKATVYLETAIKRFKPERDDPNNRGFLQRTKDLLELTKKRTEAKKGLRDFVGEETTNFSGADERRREDMKISDAARQRVEADKAAFARLKERFAREGW